MSYWDKCDMFSNENNNSQNNLFKQNNFCEKCGKRYEFIWHLIKCAKCESIREPLTTSTNGTIKPLHKNCSNCNSTEYIVNSFKNIKGNEIEYAIARKIISDGINLPIIFGNEKEQTEIYIEPVCLKEPNVFEMFKKHNKLYGT